MARGIEERERSATPGLAEGIGDAPLARVLRSPQGAAGGQMHALMARLFPICRSITGDGVRESLGIVGEHVPVCVHEVPTGTRAFDWTVPPEWNITDAYVADSQGRRVVDFRASNLHVMSYSVPVHRRMGLDELRQHLHTLPEHPDVVPYRTSYYTEDWGFCLTHRQWLDLTGEEYEVRIDSTLESGHLTYGECLLEGESDEEILLSTHICHPSMCNDNLSGVVVATWVAKALAAVSRRWSYRLLFVPGTIGAITWLSRNEARTSKIRAGLVLGGIGDAGGFTYKKSRRGDAEIDRAVAHVLGHSEVPGEVEAFSPYGYDERQFCSPGFDLPVGSLSRTRYGRYPEYHTSADDLSFVGPERLAESLATVLAVVDVLERNRTYRNLNPKCEPQLGRRGLYGPVGGQSDGGRSGLDQLAMLWVLNLSDGRHSLLDVAERSGLTFGVVADTARTLVDHDLLEEVAEPTA